MATQEVLPAMPAPTVARQTRGGEMVGRRRKTPDTGAVADALALARRRRRLEAQLEALTRARLAVVLELRLAGLSQLEVADVLDVTKARVQQLEAQAHDAGLPHDEPACPWCRQHRQ